MLLAASLAFTVWLVALAFFRQGVEEDAFAAYQSHTQTLHYAKMFLAVFVLVCVHWCRRYLGWPIAMIAIGYLLSISFVSVEAIGESGLRTLVGDDNWHGFDERSNSFLVFSIALIFGCAIGRQKVRARG